MRRVLTILLTLLIAVLLPAEPVLAGCTRACDSGGRAEDCCVESGAAAVDEGAGDRDGKCMDCTGCKLCHAATFPPMLLTAAPSVQQEMSSRPQGECRLFEPVMTHLPPPTPPPRG